MLTKYFIITSKQQSSLSWNVSRGSDELCVFCFIFPHRPTFQYTFTFLLYCNKPPNYIDRGKMKFLGYPSLQLEIEVYMHKAKSNQERETKQRQHIFSRIHRYIKFTLLLFFGVLIHTLGCMLKRDLPLMLDYTWSIFFPSFDSSSHFSVIFRDMEMEDEIERGFWRTDGLKRTLIKNIKVKRRLKDQEKVWRLHRNTHSFEDHELFERSRTMYRFKDQAQPWRLNRASKIKHS